MQGTQKGERDWLEELLRELDKKGMAIRSGSFSILLDLVTGSYRLDYRVIEPLEAKDQKGG